MTSAFSRLLAFLLLAGLALAGCADGPSTRPSTWADQAEQDPYNFNPKMEKHDISGGGLTDFDKDAFKKDLNHVLNP